MEHTRGHLTSARAESRESHQVRDGTPTLFARGHMGLTREVDTNHRRRCGIRCRAERRCRVQGHHLDGQMARFSRFLGRASRSHSQRNCGALFFEHPAHAHLLLSSTLKLLLTGYLLHALLQLFPPPELGRTGGGVALGALRVVPLAILVIRRPRRSRTDNANWLTAFVAVVSVADTAPRRLLCKRVGLQRRRWCQCWCLRWW